VGVLGLSFSGGLALVAAADPLYRPDFKFVFAVGSQDAMDHVATYYLTGQEARPDGTTERLTPHEYGALVLEYEHLEDFVPKKDEAAIRPVLREHLHEDKNAEKLAEAKLNPRQRAEAAVLMDSNSTTTRAKLAAANLKHVEEMQGLSPHGMLRTMTTPVYLLHGQADNIIPAAETLWMASELPGTTLQEVLVSPVLSHLDLEGAKPDVWDQWKLGVAFDHQHRLYVLENTTGNPGPTPGTGKVLRIDHSGTVQEIASGLSLPTAMTFGPDGNLYVSNLGFGPPPVGLGQVVKIEVP
jgi:pimeloyl-ACP methyl ester carboxylesterase